jgi:hypothetical protein
MMNFLKKSKSFISSPFVVPLILFFVTLLAYGLSFWRLGFYWDDQPISWIRYQFGSAASIKYFSDSRPVWGLLYQLTSYILPNNPVVWQMFAMFWRWAGAVTFWLVAVRLFPSRKYSALLLSLFVLLYPGFNQQWVSYVYSHFFIVLFFLLFSWYLMLRGKTIPAMVFSTLNLLMLEYFFLLEFIRPFIIFKSMTDETLPLRERLVKTFKLWLPYFVPVILAVAYRSLVFSHPGFGYSLTDELVRAPVETSTLLVKQVLSSLWVTAVAAWLQIFQFPNPNVSGMRTTILYAVVVLVVGALVFFFKRANEDQTESNHKGDLFWMLGIGGLLLLLGGIPFWMTNLPVSLGFPANRANLSFMLGACFFLLGLIELLPVRIKYLAAVLLISLSAGRQFLWSVDYMRDWNSQKNLFWQMTWRAPGLEKNTIVLTNENLEYSADNSLSAALNWIYAPDNHQSAVMNYVLFYPTNRSSLSLAPNTPVDFDFLVGKFHGNTSQTVVFYYSPPRCLRLLDPEIDSQNRLIPDDSLLRDAAQLSSTAPILSESTARMPEIYLPEPAHGWCYYFQKADLARQMGDWETVTQLGDAAFSLDDYPNDPIERFVFIEGYAHTTDWEKAVELSEDSYKVSKNYVAPLLCKLWDRIARETESTPDQRAALDKVQGKFECLP